MKTKEIKLTKDPLKNIQIMAPLLSRQCQRDVFNITYGIYMSLNQKKESKPKKAG